jgi:hypothetical protein
MLNPKIETLNSKQAQMSKTQNSKPYDLRDRTLKFAKMVRNYVKNLPKTLSNIEEAKESGYWLELTEPKEEQMIEKQNLIKEATELTKIFGSIVEKSK